MIGFPLLSVIIFPDESRCTSPGTPGPAAALRKSKIACSLFSLFNSERVSLSSSTICSFLSSLAVLNSFSNLLALSAGAIVLAEVLPAKPGCLDF